MSRNLPLPALATPPEDYDPRYLRQLVEQLGIYFEAWRNPGEGRNTTLTLTALPETDGGLEPGALFQQDGFLKVTLARKPHPAGLSATGSVGSVTVSTP